MKTFIIKFDLRRVFLKLKKSFNLNEFDTINPEIRIKSNNPDDACHLALCKFLELILQQKECDETAAMLQELVHDIRIIKAIQDVEK